MKVKWLSITGWSFHEEEKESLGLPGHHKLQISGVTIPYLIYFIKDFFCDWHLTCLASMKCHRHRAEFAFGCAI